MQHLISAEQAGQVTPIKDESHIVCGDAALRNNVNQHVDSTQPGATAQPGHGKQLATLVAKCALAGITLVETTDDRDRPIFVISRGALTKVFGSMQEVGSWLHDATSEKAEVQN